MTSMKYQARLNFITAWNDLQEEERDKDQERRQIFEVYEKMKDI